MMIDYISKTVRDAAILTNSYVAGTVLSETNVYNQLILLVDFTIGSLTSLQIKVETSNDGTTYYQETALSTSGGTTTATVNEYSFSATGKYRIPIEINDRYIKISAKGTGTVTSSSCAITASLGVN